MRYTNQTTTRTLYTDGASFIEYFPKTSADEISWSIRCAPRCDALVPAADWAFGDMVHASGWYDEETFRAYAEVASLTAEATRVTLSLVSWEPAGASTALVVLVAAAAAAALLAVLVAVAMVICICAFCWATGEEGRRGYEPIE
jgi:hypothetical protein